MGDRDLKVSVCRIELDADLPGQGKNYCVSCSRYFVSPMVLAQHERSKPHKRRCASMLSSLHLRSLCIQ